MKNKIRNLLLTFGITLFLSLLWGNNSAFLASHHWEDILCLSDSLDANEENPNGLPYPFKDRKFDKYSDPGKENPIYLKDPANIQSKTEYDPASGNYNVSENLGSLKNRFYRNPSYLSFDEYVKSQNEESTRKYWKQRAGNDDKLNSKKSFIKPILVGGETFDRIFGGNMVDIRPQGAAELTFGWNNNYNNNPQIPVNQQSVGTFDFRQRIQMNVIANIGEKLKINTNYNTEATFDFENQMKLEYTGYEDEIIKKIEAGNVSFPLNTTLITGSQSLFGIKSQLQFGRLTVTSIFSQQKGQKSSIDIAGSGSGQGQVLNFAITADNYETNKHYFLSQYFKDQYDIALANLPLVNSSVAITRVEVWVTNRSLNAVDANARNIVAFTDLGENPFANTAGYIQASATYNQKYPDNNSNTLYPQIRSIPDLRDYKNPVVDILQSKGLYQSADFERLENARKLGPNEFTFNPRLGYISLNQALNNDEVLAVAYQYSVGDQQFQVGELTQSSGIDSPNSLFLKLLKPKNLNTKSPLWDLMMKNIYSIGAYNVNSQSFKLDVLYLDNTIGSNINYIPEGPIKGVPLIRVLNLDRLNNQNNTRPDGIFDFVEGITINSASGRVIFPVREPFGSFLRNKLSDPKLGDKYAYDALYRNTKVLAQQDVAKNKFTLKGTYSSSTSSEISLNSLNIPQGAVSITAGGNKLVENQDYVVDYTIGKVTILNEGILSSGLPLKITTESNSLFNIQTRSFLGTRFDYKASKDFLLGATVLNLSERPLTQKVNIGDEPINNTIWGVDGTYRTESQYITKLIDKLPFIQTKEPSSFSITGEYASLIPGHAKAIGASGTSYIDDFEGSKNTLDLKNFSTWLLASTPQGQNDMFPEAKLSNDLAYGFKRSKMAWYTVDPVFYGVSALKPANISKDEQSDHYARQVIETELFPNKSFPNGQIPSLSIFNMAYYPKERGPNNYTIDGLNADGKMARPIDNWAGIMRRIETTDFDAANIDFIEFWMMDPFVKGPNNGGDLYFNLGSISEDILKDSRKSFENGLPGDGSNAQVSITKWGRVSDQQTIIQAFDNSPEARAFQDVGLDGLSSPAEAIFFKEAYLDQLEKKFGSQSQAYQNAVADASGDNFVFPRDDIYNNKATAPILSRYKEYNGTDGNSKVAGATPVSSTNKPDVEDVNGDNTLDETEAYYQYKVKLRPENMLVGQNYITSVVNAPVSLPNGKNETVRWYQFRIPIRTPEKIVGGISDFRSIRFMRMFFKDFQDSMVCRFGKLQLIRGDWRKYNSTLNSPGENTGGGQNDDQTAFDVSTINLEEDGKRIGIPYVIPPGIQRQQIYGANALQKLNEQSLKLTVCGLKDGAAKAAYKNVQLDIRQYQRLKMFIHAQLPQGAPEYSLNKGDLSVFIRLGTDFDDNYYEYEIPIKPTSGNTADENAIWPSENDLDLEFQKLLNLKEQRNISNYPLTKVYPALTDPPNDGKNKIYIKGVPSLNNVRTIMIGVRNSSKNFNVFSPDDDGSNKCAEIWVNELRLTDFTEKGGWAATARMNAKLADFATVQASGSRSTPGFGTIEQKITERKVENATLFDVSTNIEAGKVFPEKAGLKVPVFLGYSQQIITPQYNPLDPDVKVEKINNTKYKDSISQLISDVTTRKSFNVTNLRKTKTNNKPSHLYDIENLNATYAYSEIDRHNINIESSNIQNYRAALGYTFSSPSKPLEPFKGFNVKSPFFKPISEFNFSPLPSSISFRADVERYYAQSTLRAVDGQQAEIPTTFDKRFTFNRTYALQYDLTKALKFDFNAINNAVIDEPYGAIDTEQKKDTLKLGLLKGGRNVHYHHQANINYNLPTAKIPYLEFVNSTLRYTADFDWQAGARINDTVRYGNTIQNAASKQVNAQLNMPVLFNKFNYLRNLLNGNKQNDFGKPGASLKSPAGLMGTLNKKLKGAALDSANKAKKKEEGPKTYWFDPVVKTLISVKNLSFSYTQTEGTQLPGFVPVNQYMGMNFATGQAPGIPFIAGQQEDFNSENNVRKIAARNDWLVKDTTLNLAFTQTNVQQYNFRLTMEPLPSMRIQLDANKSFSNNISDYFRSNGIGFKDYNINETGNLSISYISLNTAFSSDYMENGNYRNQTFQELKAMRAGISQQLAEERKTQDPTYTGGKDTSGIFYKGYSGTSQNVLVPAFLAAYGGSKSNDPNANPFSYLPKPNWNIQYDGLSRIPFFQKYFNSITLAHAYKSALNVASFQSNADYSHDNSPFKSAQNLGGDFNPQYNYASISIMESFTPLVRVETVWKNSLSTKFEYKTDRQLNMNFSNAQLSETRGKEFVGGAGYRLRKFRLPFNIFGKDFGLDNGLDFKADFSYRLSNSIIRKIAEDVDQIVAGTKTISIKTSADYIINERFNIRAFYEYRRNIPALSNSPITANTYFGISLRLILQ